MSICCGASNCSKKEQCRTYENNYFEDHLNELAQFIDWSTHGWGKITNDGCESHYDCGDLSDGYPYFKEVKIEK